jgi:hypothetical protein
MAKNRVLYPRQITRIIDVPHEIYVSGEDANRVHMRRGDVHFADSRVNK